jgi:hypothetical protein
VADTDVLWGGSLTAVEIDPVSWTLSATVLTPRGQSQPARPTAVPVNVRQLGHRTLRRQVFRRSKLHPLLGARATREIEPGFGSRPVSEVTDADTEHVLFDDVQTQARCRRGNPRALIPRSG